MNCKTAQHVWQHKGGLISGLNCKMPGLMAYLIQSATDWRDKKPDPFDTAVKASAGDGNYRVTHSDGESQMSTWVHDVLGDKVANREVTAAVRDFLKLPSLEFANVCCNGCSVSDGTLSPDQELAIQMAAVSLNPDGTPFKA